MKKLTISLTAVLFMGLAPSVFARDLTTIEKVRESLWLKGVSKQSAKITMTYANNDLTDSMEIPVASDPIEDADEADNTDLPEELFVPLQDV